jgi:predicted helicase
MASYAMAHLKLDMLLSETGYKPIKEQRFRVYLTNSLEEHHPDTGTLFANWLSTEANEANHVKRDTPVMVVLGNPPYSVSSSNKSAWIEKLTTDYKKDLNERNIQPLSDDYIKFIRFGQYFIDKNGSGVLAYISNNSFIDGIIHRQMRKHLLESFDKIYILDLHGNAKKKEVCPDGSVDQNVFDIMQGVSINIFVKTGLRKKNELGQAFHNDLFGKRDFKYNLLNESSLKSIHWNILEVNIPNFFLVKKYFDKSGFYEKGFKIDEIFNEGAGGIASHRDNFVIDFKLQDLVKRINDFFTLTSDEVKTKYNLIDTTEWQVETAQKQNRNDLNYTNISYRPFDVRKIYFDDCLITRSRRELMKHFLKENYGIVTCKRQENVTTSFITTHLIDQRCFSVPSAVGKDYVFPLYVYPVATEQKAILQSNDRIPNLNSVIIQQITNNLDITYTNEKEIAGNTFAPIDILDYIYAVLHSPNYREKYKEFLKIDFPRVPYPKDTKTFWQLVKLGGEIRQVHLLESPVVEKYITTYPQNGTNEVEKVRYENGQVWINSQQYFANVPPIAWEFYIGGYQPAQKWLKDRKGRILSYEDILHYQKIIVALSETDRLMKEIDGIEIE